MCVCGGGGAGEPRTIKTDVGAHRPIPDPEMKASSLDVRSSLMFSKFSPQLDSKVSTVCICKRKGLRSCASESSRPRSQLHSTKRSTLRNRLQYRSSLPFSSTQCSPPNPCGHIVFTLPSQRNKPFTQVHPSVFPISSFLQLHLPSTPRGL